MSSRLVGMAGEVAYGSFILFSGGTIATVIAAIGSIIIARLLGPELYGIFSLALIVPSLLLMFIDFGIAPALTRFSAKLKEEGGSLQLASFIKTGFIFKLLTCSIVFFFGLVFSDFLSLFIINRPELTFLVRVVVFLVLFNGISSTVESILIGFEDMKGFSLLSVARTLAKTILSPLLIFVGFGVLGAIMGYILSYAAMAILGILMVYFKHYLKLSLSSSVQYNQGNSMLNNLKVMLGYGSPLYLAGTIQSLLGIYQGMVLAYFVSNVMIGNFSIAMNFTTLITLLTSPIATALFPAFSKPLGEEIRRMVRYAVKYTAMLVIPASVFVILMSRELVFIIYGPEYMMAPQFLALYSIIFLYVGFGSIVLGSFFNGIGETRVNFKATLIHSILFIPSALALTKGYGVTGLIVSILLSSLASLIYSLLVSKRRFDVGIEFSSSLRIYIASGISTIPVLMLTTYSPFPHLINLFLGATLFIASYLTIIPLIGGINNVDVENFTLMFKKIKPLNIIVNLILSYEAKLLGSKQ